MKTWRSYVFLLTLAASVSCKRSAEPIAFDKDQCQFCRMTISDKNFGAELITEKGRVYKFDAAECLVNFVNEEEPETNQMLVIAYDEPGKLHPVDLVDFVVSSSYRSPMGENLAAFKSEFPSKEEKLSWEEVFDKLSHD